MAQGFKQAKVGLETHGGRETDRPDWDFESVFVARPQKIAPQLCMCVSLDEPFKPILPLQEPPRCEFTLCHAGAKHNTDGRDVARNSREIYSAKKKNICSQSPAFFFIPTITQRAALILRDENLSNPRQEKMAGRENTQRFNFSPGHFCPEQNLVPGTKNLRVVKWSAPHKSFHAPDVR